MTPSTKQKKKDKNNNNNNNKNNNKKDTTSKHLRILFLLSKKNNIKIFKFLIKKQQQYKTTLGATNENSGISFLLSERQEKDLGPASSS